MITVKVVETLQQCTVTFLVRSVKSHVENNQFIQRFYMVSGSYIYCIYMNKEIYLLQFSSHFLYCNHVCGDRKSKLSIFCTGIFKNFTLNIRINE